MQKEDNDLLTQVCGDAPMGAMMREWFWIPAVRAGRLEAGGDPVRVRLFGQNLVAFRAADGRVGVFDEYCPHRRCSLALARNEDNALRCIFHGWKFDVSGQCVEVPTHAVNAEAFAAKVPLIHFPVREAGGLVWIWMGKQAPGPFPDFAFNNAPAHAVRAAVTTIPVNWVQGVEATIDSSHVGFLHRDWVGALGPQAGAVGQQLAPRYEIQETCYGLRGAAIRETETEQHIRLTEYVMPFFAAAPTGDDAFEVYQILVPRDDESTHWFIVKCNLDGSPLDEETILAAPGADLDNWVPIKGGPDEHWGQDRQAMREGRSFSGFSQGGLLAEDTIVQVSMGSIVDRTQEYLSTSDLYVMRARRMLMNAARDYIAGKMPLGAQAAIEVDYSAIRGATDQIPKSIDWRDHFTIAAHKTAKAATQD